MTESDDPFESPRLLIERAREHIGEVDAEIKAFFDRKPYTRVIELDRETGLYAHKIRLTAKLPGRIKAVVKDVASNLRDVLDHAVYGSAVALSGTNLDNTGFPFARDAAGVIGELNSKRLSGNPPEIRALLASFEPHATGNQLLWGLNRIRVPNTHRILVPVGLATLSSTISEGSGTVTSGSQLGYCRWDTTKNEVEYLRLGPGSTFDYKIEISFDVTFENVEALSGEPAISALHAMTSEVERILSAIEAETARILGGR